jgi:hypothetical protein
MCGLRALTTDHWLNIPVSFDRRDTCDWRLLAIGKIVISFWHLERKQIEDIEKRICKKKQKKKTKRIHGNRQVMRMSQIEKSIQVRICCARNTQQSKTN